MTTPFTPGKKVPMEYAGVFDKEDYGNYFVEGEAERLRENYTIQEHLKQKEDGQ